MRLVFILFIFSVCYTSQAQQIRILLENCTLEKESLKEIENAFKFQLQFYNHIFSDTAKADFKARVFATEKEFNKYAKAKANYNPIREHSNAFYSPELNEMILHKEVENFTKVFSHELSHSLLQHYCALSYPWIDEGLAELFEDIILFDTSYHFDITQLPKVRKASKFFQDDNSIEDSIFSKDFYDTYSSDKNYTLSWAVVFYLFRTNLQILSRIIHGECNEINNNLYLNYPGQLELLQLDVKSYFLNQPGSR